MYIHPYIDGHVLPIDAQLERRYAKHFSNISSPVPSLSLFALKNENPYYDDSTGFTPGTALMANPEPFLIYSLFRTHFSLRFSCVSFWKLMKASFMRVDFVNFLIVTTWQAVFDVPERLSLPYFI